MISLSAGSFRESKKFLPNFDHLCMCPKAAYVFNFLHRNPLFSNSVLPFGTDLWENYSWGRGCMSKEEASL